MERKPRKVRGKDGISRNGGSLGDEVKEERIRKT